MGSIYDTTTCSKPDACAAGYYLRLWSLVVSLAWMLALGASFAAPEQPKGVEDSSDADVRVALLIGAAHYRSQELRLPWARNDVEELAKVFQASGFYVYKFIDENWEHSPPSVASSPRAERRCREKIQQELADRLNRSTDRTILVVYFTGHAFVDGGQPYFVPVDGELDRLRETAIPLTWVRQEMEKARGLLKVLILDTCYSGAPGSADLWTALRDARGVYVLTSCMANQHSFVWDSKGLSVFTYWLIHGLKGQADGFGEGAKADGQITVDELYYFTRHYVPLTVSRRFEASQVPDRMVGPGVPVERSILHVPQRSLKAVLDEIAEQISTILHLQGIKTVGVVDFRVAPESRKQHPRLGEEAARFCADRVQESLTQRSAGAFRVVLRSVLQEKLRERGITSANILEAPLDDLKVVEAIGVQAIVVGEVRGVRPEDDRRGISLVEFRVRLRPTDLPAVQFSCAMVGTLPLELLPTTDVSAAVSPSGHVETPSVHPMADSNFPYRVFLRVRGRELRGKFVDGNLYFPVSPGDVFTIEFELDSQKIQPQLDVSKDLILVRALVDGRSTSLEIPRIVEDGPFAKSVEPEQVVELAAQTVPIDEAAAWVVPLSEGTVRRCIPGFRERCEPQGSGQQQGGSSQGDTRIPVTLKYREFLVVEAKDLPPEHWDYSEQLGVVTVAFYSARPAKLRTRGSPLIVRPGAGGETTTVMWTDVVPDRLLAVVKVRYVHEDCWKRLEAPAVDFSR